MLYLATLSNTASRLRSTRCLHNRQNSRLFTPQNNGKGLNITVPFKEDAWSLADTHSKRAQRAGAVNTLKLQDDGSLFGDTTDGTGLINDLLHNHNIQLQDKKLLIIGAGGAVRGALQALLEQHPVSLLISNRTAAKAIQLAEDFSELGNISGCGLNEVSDNFDIIINGTSASLQGDLPALPATIFSENSCSYDMMYGAQPTPFMKWSTDCADYSTGIKHLDFFFRNYFLPWLLVNKLFKLLITQWFTYQKTLQGITAQPGQ